MQFRKDINGLRALAVVAVVLFHFSPSWVPGGFAGVDVFFVISGFLMTGIILRGINDNAFSLLKFYHSRVKRILPALSVVCLFAVSFSFFFLYDTEFKDTINQAISSLTFWSNFYFWKTSSYFSPGGETKFLLHTWSLSTEWQFYIVYPLIIFLISKVVDIKNFIWVILFGLIASFIFSVYASPKWVTTSYYLLPTRGWQMLLGGLAYLTVFQLNRRQLNLLSSIGLTLIIMSYFIISKDNVWPGYLALLPTFGAFMILIGNPDFFILKNKFVQLIGTYSYSIYLWHWIIVVLAYRYTDMNVLVVLLGCVLSCVLGFLSYELIEKKGLNRVNKLFVLLSFLLAFSFYYSFEMIIKHRGISNTVNNELVNYYNNNEQNTSAPWIDNLCKKEEKCIKGGVFLWGDSHAHALYYGLKNAGITNFSALTTSSCAPSIIYPDYKLSSRITCNDRNKKAIAHIKLKKPEVVILARRFSHEKTDWQLIASTLKNLGVKKVIVLGPVPQFKGSLPLLVAKKYMDENLIKRSDMDKSIFDSNNKMNRIKNKEYIYVDVLSTLCSSGDCIFQTEVGNNYKLISFDYGHLSYNGSQFIVNKFIVDNL